MLLEQVDRWYAVNLNRTLNYLKNLCFTPVAEAPDQKTMFLSVEVYAVVVRVAALSNEPMQIPSLPLVVIQAQRGMVTHFRDLCHDAISCS